MFLPKAPLLYVLYPTTMRFDCQIYFCQRFIIIPKTRSFMRNAIQIVRSFFIFFPKMLPVFDIMPHKRSTQAPVL